MSVCSALAAVVFFSRAWLVQTWGSPLPFWDQWDAELINLYSPWLTGSLHWTDLFRSHNEHRILLTRLADLALFGLCNGWNPWAQLLLNAVLHAVTAAILAALFWTNLPVRSRPFFLTGIALLFISACGWQNALYGFQSQVYFANLFAVAAIAGLCSDTPFSLRWWLGLVAASLAFFSNGGGILVVPAALAIHLSYAWKTPRAPRAWLALALLAALLGIACLMDGSTPQHATFHAKTARHFFLVLAHCMAWPWLNLGALCIVMQLPLAWLVVTRWRMQTPLNGTERCAVALGLFAVLQGVAIAYSRGGVLPESRPLSRYQDPLLLGVVGQLFAVIKNFSRGSPAGRVAGLVWCGAALAGLIGLTETNFSLHLPFKRAQDQANLAIVRDYASTRDALAFTRNPDFSGPHPDPNVVQHAIDDPEMRAILPKAVLASDGRTTEAPPLVIRHAFPLFVISLACFAAALFFLICADSDRTHLAVPANLGQR